MKIMLDATPLLLASAGVKSILYHWIGALREAGSQHSFHLYPPLSEIGDLRHDASVVRRSETLRGIFMTLANQRLGIQFPERCARGMDLFHATNQVRRPPSSVPLTATLHDLTVWRMPHLHTPGNIAADKRYADQVLRRASGLIAVSEHTRRDAIELLGLHPDRVTTIHNAVAEAYFEPCEPAVRQKPYILHLGTIEPRKNIDTLLDAWLQLPRDLRDSHELLIAGPAGWASDPTIARLKSAPPGVTWLGYVPESSVPALIRGALALAYPSLYEGFGLPLAQAMACGTAALTSNVSAMPEVAGDGALLVDPQSAAAIRNGLARLIEDPELRRRLGEQGRTRAALHFRWAANASKSIAFFERAAA
ncbi:MAG: glycosyltransferase family 4 protein [Acidobacteria bacterium]|nr:glycosyltransferase family 4 protein [Acidobacteriota bacterium]